MLSTLNYQEKLKALVNYTQLRQQIMFCNNLQYLGEGSSRTVYDIKNRKVLKVARNKKGRVQNLFEANVKGFDNIRAKIFASCPKGTWVIMERLEKIGGEWTNTVGKELGLELSLRNFAYFSFYSSSDPEKSEQYKKHIDNLEKVMADKHTSELYEFISQYQILTGDVSRDDSWGVRKDGRVVLLDYGLNKKLYDKYY